MRKSFITKEYSLEPISGCKNMLEQRAFFTSKILEIEDVLTVGSTNITWSESKDNTQGIRVEDGTDNNFDSYKVKDLNQEILISSQQSTNDINEYTKWELKINIREIIKQYIFANIKTNRIFENVENDMTINGVNNAIYDYINYNVYPRIGFFNIIFYVQYYKIGTEYKDGVLALQYNPIFRKDLITLPPISGETTEDYLKRIEYYKKNITITNFQISTDSNSDIATVIYKQTLSSQNYKFDYYFDVVWKKL